jgi:hypothetical protein
MANRIKKPRKLFIALVKPAPLEQYVFLYREDRLIDCLRALGRFASNPELSFTWGDAATLGLEMRGLAADPEGGAA